MLHILLSIIVCTVWIALCLHSRYTNSCSASDEDSKSHAAGANSLPIPNVGVGLPFFGNVFQMDRRRPDLTLMHWTRNLGPVFSMNVLHEKWLVVGGYEELRDMLVTQGQAFAGRQRSDVRNFRRFIVTSMFDGSHDIINADSTQLHYVPLKKAAHRGIRHYGDGMTRLESTLSTMAGALVDKIASYNGQPVDIRNDVYSFIIKVAVAMISGRLVHDNTDVIVAKLRQLDFAVNRVLRPTAGIELDMFPFLRYLGHPIFKQIQQIRNLRDNLWDAMWQHSSQSYSPTAEPSCIMHAIAQLLDKQSTHYDRRLGPEHARGTFMDLVVASILTTTNYAYALLNILLHNPTVLRNLQQEVDHIVGSERRPSIFDRNAMPYAAATVCELLRYASLLPGLPHVAQKTTTLAGKFHVPKGTVVFPFFTPVHYDKDFWGDPEVFRPERFMDEATGQLLSADHPVRKHVLAFGAGNRMCVAEAFSQKRLFIFLTSIVQAFDLVPGDASLVPCSVESHTAGGVNSPLPYKVKFIARSYNVHQAEIA